MPFSIPRGYTGEFGDVNASPIVRRAVRFNGPALALSRKLITESLRPSLSISSNNMRAHNSFETVVYGDDNLLGDYRLADDLIKVHLISAILEIVARDR